MEDYLPDKIENLLRRYIVFTDKEETTAITLWIFGTYLMDVWQLWPKLYIYSPEKECGKTMLLSIIEALVKDGKMASNITTSALNRLIESKRPSLCIDEADLFLKKNEELNGVINAGHTRRTAVRIMSEKNPDGKWEPREFSLWCAQAIAGIGSQSDTLMSRSIKIELRRKFPTEKMESVPHDFFERCHEIRDELDNWAKENDKLVWSKCVSLPANGSDRAKDNWLPLFKIAASLKNTWDEKALKAFERMEISKASRDEMSTGLELLSDISMLLNDCKEPCIPSKGLLWRLINNEDLDWCNFNYGRPITSKWLAKTLKPYGITPFKNRDSNAYAIDELSEAIKRYLGHTLE